MEDTHRLEYDDSFLVNIISKGEITIAFQPIISLKNGDVLGYEALCRGPKDTPFENPKELFDRATLCNKLVELERITKIKAIRKFQELKMDKKLFLNIDPICFWDNDDDNSFLTDELLDLSSNQLIFEITEQSCIKDFHNFNQVILKYKQKGIKIAIDDVGKGFSNLNMIVNVEPMYLKIDMDLIRNLHCNPVKQALIKSLVNFSNQTNSVLIAEGIELLEELEVLIHLGVHYGQGYFIHKPAAEPPVIPMEIETLISHKNQATIHIKLRNITTTIVGEISQPLPYLDRYTLGDKVNSIFEKNSSIQGLPVIDNKKPIGLLMKHNFYYHLGKQYGYSIFMKRRIEWIMDQSPLIVDYDTPMDQVSEIAMKRNVDTLYDYIIVTKGTHYHGVVSVKDLLQKTTEIQLEYAKYASPLTGLPGNIMIEQKLQQVLASNNKYSVLYFDLDNFKSYNDIYGFDQGDRIILMTAELIKESLQAFHFTNGFLGHIGGDDFVAVVESHRINKFSDYIIQNFNERILSYYSQNDISKGYITAQNRHGAYENYPIMSISIAIVTNKKNHFETSSQLVEYASQIKKQCKACFISNYIVG